MEVIYANMIAAIDSPNLVDVSDGSIIEKGDLTPEEATEIDAQDRRFPIFGRNAQTAEKNTSSGYTTAWAQLMQRTTDGKTVFPKPEDELMAGLSGYIVEEFSELWFPQPETIGESIEG